MRTEDHVGPFFAPVMNGSRRRRPVPVLLLALLVPVIAGCGERLAAVPGDAAPSVMRLIDELEATADSWRQDGDDVVSPAAFGQLVGMGSAAVPTVLHVVQTNSNVPVRQLLIDVVGRIGDAAAVPVLQRLASAPDTRSSSIEALGRIGGPAARAALHELLARQPTENVELRLPIFKSLLRAGDASVLGEVIRIGLAAPNDSYERSWCANMVLRHDPLRRALGFESPFTEGWMEATDDELLLRAADEWYRETVLQIPSPWRTREPAAFAPPCAEAKRAAWTMLRDAVARGNGEFSRLRVHAVDPPLAEADAGLPLTLLAGFGHSRELAIWSWEPAGDVVRCHRFALSGGAPRSRFPGDDAAVTCATGTVAAADYLRLIAGVRTIAAARLVPWWAGPGFGASITSMNFATCIAGPACGSTAPPPFCGYLGSHDWLRSEPLLAAWRWHGRFVDAEVSFAAAQPTPAVRGRFAALFRDASTLWDADESWWWVRERMVAMAGPCGDDTLLAPLARYLAADYVERPDSRARTAAAAITSLAVLTGKDLRFGSDGEPRSLRDAAAAYRDLLAR